MPAASLTLQLPAASRLLLVFALLGFAAGCGSEPPRTREEIFRELATLPRLYLSDPGGRRVIAPADRGIFVEGGEICWPALECTAEDCPGRSGEEPFVFINPEPGFTPKPDGTFEYNFPGRNSGAATAGQCPKCLERRNPARETAAERQRYIDAVKPHELPESLARRQQLEAEMQSLVAEFEARRGRPAVKLD